MKKVMTIFLFFIMLMVNSPAAAFAGEAFSYAAEAQKLNDLGLYKGISTETFDPDLGTALDRETGVVMLLRLFGLEADAAAITDADMTLAKFRDAASISSWAKNAVAYAVTNGLVQGYPDGTFGPKAALNGKAYCTLILRQLGFTPDYNHAPAELADKGGLTADEITKFAGKELLKDDLVGISFGTLRAADKDGQTVIEHLVAEKVVDEGAIVDSGLDGVLGYDGGGVQKSVGLGQVAPNDYLKAAVDQVTKTVTVTGKLAARTGKKAAVMISAPDNKEFAGSVTCDDTGGFTYIYSLTDPIAGDYLVEAGPVNGPASMTTSFTWLQ